MDPQQTLTELLDALELRDWDAVDELSDALLTWMENRGFPPITIGSEKLGKEWHRAVATFLCHAAASKANDARNRGRKGGHDDAP